MPKKQPTHKTVSEDNGAVLKKEFSLKIKRVFPAGHSPKPADGLVVLTPNEHESILLFYHLRPPILLGTPEENQATLESMGQVETECVAEIVIPASRLEEFAEVMSSQAEKVKKKLSKPEKKAVDKGIE